MGEVEKPAWSVVAKTAGNTVGSAVGGLLTAAGLVTGNPVLAIGAVPVGAFAGAVTENMVEFGARQWQVRAERVERFGAIAATEADTTVETLVDEAFADPRKLEVLGLATEAASRALDDRKIDLLARIYAHGAYRHDLIDETAVMLDAVRQIEGPHLRVMEVLSRPGPHFLPSPDTQDAMLNNMLGRASSTPGRSHLAVWRNDQLAAESGVGDALSALIAKLAGLGMVYDEGLGRVDYQPLWQLTAFGQNCLRYLADNS
ncbi:hypothetical protein V6U89_18035 [Micromonospora sp. CPCC 206171]|uniref:hypothetical protein n=1 Tax=Micromonospora sp. CPCC 206171 TaxID=3122405 RepID=UPI002FEF24D1